MSRIKGHLLARTSTLSVILLLSLVLLVSLLAACIGGTDSRSWPGSEVGGGQGTLNLSDSGPITLDPATTADATSTSYIVQIFSGLVRLDENMIVVPDIAENWDKSPDGKSYTFHLRRDVKFHDGRPVTAADFQYSWERALNPTTQSQTAGTYLNDIVGADALLAGQSVHLAGVLLLDSYTLQVNIKTPVTYFLEKMAFPTAFVVEKANVQSGDKWWQHPVGTGPFKLQQWQTDNMVVLQRNDDYHGTKASLSKVVFHLFNGNPMDLYQQGDIDVTVVGGGYMGLVTDPANPISKELHTFPELSVYYIGFNITAPPFDDVKVRQAFCYAVDKERVISLSTKNVASSAYGVLPPGMPGYNENLRGLHFDPEQAKVLLAASKYSDVNKMPPLVLTTSGWGNDISGIVGGVIAEWRRNLGVEVTVRQLEPDAFLYALAQEKDNLFDFGWIADYPDPQDFLDVLFRTGAQNNAGSYSNLKLDAILDLASVEPDVNTRYKLYQDAEEIVVQDAAILPISFAQNYVLVKPYVKDYVLSPLGYPLLGKISIQK